MKLCGDYQHDCVDEMGVACPTRDANLRSSHSVIARALNLYQNNRAIGEYNSQCFTPLQL